jgi:glycosyltransferase involved in cell wall biosynthesis
MRRTGVRVPLHVVPHLPADGAVEMDPGAVRSFRRAYGIPDAHFLFYTADTWVLRKAWWKTLHAFLLAFKARDAVTLLIKTTPIAETEAHAPGAGRAESARQLVEILSDYRDRARVVLETGTVRAYDMALLHRAGDAYVSLTRSEGWGLGAYDAAAAGNPVVITGWGGQCEFLSPEHACLVNYRLVPVSHPFAPHSYQQDQIWADADLDDAIRWMRRLAANPEEARARGRGLAQHLRKKFDPGRIIGRFLQALEGDTAPVGISRNADVAT